MFKNKVAEIRGETRILVMEFCQRSLVLQAKMFVLPHPNVRLDLPVVASNQKTPPRKSNNTRQTVNFERVLPRIAKWFVLFLFKQTTFDDCVSSVLLPSISLLDRANWIGARENDKKQHGIVTTACDDTFSFLLETRESLYLHSIMVNRFSMLLGGGGTPFRYP